jgi:hypothetical protein
LIIGQQPPLLDLAPAEAQKRFNLVFHDFIKVFTNPHILWQSSSTISSGRMAHR